jgi:hypothetical protein
MRARPVQPNAARIPGVARPRRTRRQLDEDRDARLTRSHVLAAGSLRTRAVSRGQAMTPGTNTRNRGRSAACPGDSVCARSRGSRSARKRGCLARLRRSADDQPPRRAFTDAPDSSSARLLSTAWTRPRAVVRSRRGASTTRVRATNRGTPGRQRTPTPAGHGHASAAPRPSRVDGGDVRGAELNQRGERRAARARRADPTYGSVTMAANRHRRARRRGRIIVGVALRAGM